MNEVFISYKAEEYDDANWVKSTLENEGITCWMAPESMTGGSNYAVEIPKAIKGCKIFVLILSAKSQSSQWVAREVDRAINEGKVILPFMLENCELKDDFNFYLTNVQRYNAYENKTRAIEKMLDEIRVILGINKSEDVDLTEKQDVKENVFLNDDFTKPEKSKKHKESKAEKNISNKSNKKFTKKKAIVSIAIAVIAVIALCVIIIPKSFNGNKVIIAGKTFKKNDFSITLTDKVLTDDDMNNIAAFNELNEISFTNCKFPSTNISVIFEKVSEKLILDNCGITNEHLNSVDFEELDANFSVLKLDNNPKLTDISMIFTESAHNFKEITINSCAVSDISYMSDVYSYDLEKFEADNNGILDVSALSCYDCLEHLSLANNNITSIQSLSKLNNLKYIDVEGNELTNLVGLEQSIYLETLYAGKNKVSNLDGILNCTQLSTVDISENTVTDISVLSKSLLTLQNVNLASNNIDDLSALSGGVKLQELNVDNNKITNLNALEQCVEISKLSAANNKISSVSGITNCKFKTLNLANNQLTTIEGIVFYSGSKTLEEFETVAGVTGKTFGLNLDLSNNNITSVDLKLSDVGSVSFDKIKLYGNNISNISGLERVTIKQLAIQYNENLDFTQLNKNDVYSYCIIECPMDKRASLTTILGDKVEAFYTEQEYLQTQNNQ